MYPYKKGIKMIVYLVSAKWQDLFVYLEGLKTVLQIHNNSAKITKGIKIGYVCNFIFVTLCLKSLYVFSKRAFEVKFSSKVILTYEVQLILLLNKLTLWNCPKVQCPHYKDVYSIFYCVEFIGSIVDLRYQADKWIQIMFQL